MPSIRSRAIYQAFKLFGSPFDVHLPIARQRANIEQQAKFARMPPEVDVESFTIGSIYAEALSPPGAAAARALLYLHGGGYTMGSCNTHRTLAARVAAESHTKTYLFNYRLAPENPYPAALEDSQEVYYWLLNQGIAPRYIVLAGDSAGGGLAVALSIALRDEGSALPGGIVCISPWVDLTLSGESISSCAHADPLLSRETSEMHAGWYVQAGNPVDPLISPVFADLRRLPPMLVQVGEYEILRSDAERLVEHACRDGVDAALEIWEGMWHVWHAYAGLIPEARSAIKIIGLFIKARLITQDSAVQENHEHYKPLDGKIV